MSSVCAKMSLHKTLRLFVLLTINLQLIVRGELNQNSTSNENLTSSLVSCNDDEKCKSITRDRVLLLQKFDDYIRETSSVLLNSHHSERMKHSSVIYGLVVAAEENQLNQQCYNEIMQIYHGINRKAIWAMKSEWK